MVAILTLVCSKEKHQDENIHYQMVIKCRTQGRWFQAQNYVGKTHYVKVNFPDNYSNCYQVCGSILTFVSAPRTRDALTSKMNYTETCKSHKKCSFDALDFHSAAIKNKIKTKTFRFYPSSKRW